MACILVKPNGEQKGILSVTTSEVEQILDNGELIDEAIKLKKSYYLGLHYNWHPVETEISDAFDFHFLETKDAVFLNGREKLLEIDACNFTPRCFSNPRNNPVWDVLIVGRTANFKRPFKTLETMRELFDQGHSLKILWVCPMDFENKDDRAIAEAYEKLFSHGEKELFTLLNPQSNNPFTFSRTELSHFYLSSRTFVHFADMETRCRVAAYAFCAGVPVIGNTVIANILPAEIAVEPTFYKVKNDDYVNSILDAIKNSTETNQNDCLNILCESKTLSRLVKNINNCLKPHKEYLDTQFLQCNLDVRLGSAHTGKSSSNSYAMNLVQFIQALNDPSSKTLFDNINNQSLEPEQEITNLMNTEKPKEQRQQLFSIRDHRKVEIAITRRGKFKFLVFRMMKWIDALPLIGSQFRRIYLCLRKS